MKYTLVLVLAAIGLIISSCGGKMDEAAEAMSNLKSIAESGENIEKTQGVLEQRRTKRRASGDTLAMDTEKLKQYLPSGIDGYDANEAESNSVEMPGMSWSVVNRTYTKPDGSTVKITLTDYNASEVGWAGMSAMFAIKWKVDNASETSRTIQTDNPLINGHERLGKQDGSVALTYGLGGRFILQIEVSNQNGFDFARSVAQNMKLQDLAGL